MLDLYYLFLFLKNRKMKQRLSDARSRDHA